MKILRLLSSFKFIIVFLLVLIIALIGSNIYLGYFQIMDMKKEVVSINANLGRLQKQVRNIDYGMSIDDIRGSVDDLSSKIDDLEWDLSRFIRYSR